MGESESDGGVNLGRAGQAFFSRKLERLEKRIESTEMRSTLAAVVIVLVLIVSIIQEWFEPISFFLGILVGAAIGVKLISFYYLYK